MPGKIIRTGKSEAGHTYRLRFDHGIEGSMSLFVGRGKDSVSVGAVADARNFEYCMDEADEEMACLLAEARAEFGWSR